MNKKYISTNKAPKAIGPYSQAVQVDNVLYVSGQIPFIPSTMELVSEEVRLQTDQALKNLKAILEESQFTLENVVKVNIYIKDMNDFTEINEVYSNYFMKNKPARACVEVARLPRDVKVEIDAIAVK